MPRRVQHSQDAPNLLSDEPTPNLTQQRLAEAQALSVRLASLNEATALLIASNGLDAILRTLVQQARWVLDFQHCRLVLCEGSGYRIQELRSDGPHSCGVRRSLGNGAEARALALGQAQLLHQLTPEDDGPPDMGSALILPLRNSAEVIGTLNFYARAAGQYTLDDVRIAYALAMQLGALLQRERLFSDVQQTRDELQTVLESSRDGVLVADRSGRVLLLNRSLRALLLLPERPLAGERISTLARGVAERFADPPALRAALRAVAADPSQPPATLALADGRTIEWSSAALEGSGTLDGYVITVRDISARVELERLREDLVHMLVHDLRTPLSSMRLGLDLVQLMVQEQAEAAEILAISRQSADNLIGQINTILDVSKLEAGRLELEPALVSLTPLLEGVAARFGELARQRRQTLRVEAGPDLPPLLADAALIQRLVENLLGNALKFTPDGGLIELGARAQLGERVLLWVRDSGPGIPADQRGRIFEKYGQVRGPRPRSGTGLGLTFCQLVAVAHGGQISVDDAPGGGSLFWVELPTGPSPSTPG